MRIWVKTGDISRELSPYLDGDYVGVDEVREGLRDHEVRVDGRLRDHDVRADPSYGDMLITGTRMCQV